MHARILSATMIALVALTLTIRAPESRAAPATRLSWQEFAKDPARVESLRLAVQVMKSRDAAAQDSAEYRRSWQYWAGIHGYLGPGALNGTVEEYIEAIKDAGLWRSEWQPYFDQVRNLNRPADSEKVWDQCQHRTAWFLAWHRLFLIHFERVLQESAKDTTLRLPYWDYTDTAHVGMPGAFLPARYQDAAGNKQDNPLFNPLRAPGWSAQPPTTLDPDLTNADGLLRTSDFLPFQRTLERSIHGAVHCGVMDCPAVAMGAVPYSANDPLFWLHHANIDRLWACWEAVVGHSNPSTPEFLDQTYTFPDPQGQFLTVAVRQLFDGSLVDYQYEKTTDCPRTPAMTATSDETASAQIVEDARMALGGDVELAKSPAPLTIVGHRSTLAFRAAPAPMSDEVLESFVLDADPRLAVRIELQVDRITYAHHPGASLKLFLAKRGSEARALPVGSISFFDSRHRQHAEDEGSTTFDVTEAVRQLAATREDLGELDIIVEATTGRLGEPGQATIESRAALTIDGVRLQSRAHE